MQFFIAALLGGFSSVMASLVGRALLALGMTFVTYKGVNVATDALVVMMKSNFASLDGDAGMFVQWLWLDKALSLIVSAFATSLTIKGISGSVTKLKIGKSS